VTSDSTPLATPDRRTFLKTVGAAAIAFGAAPVSEPVLAQAAPPKLRLGVDAFSLGAQNWTPFQTLDSAAKNGVDMVHFSEVRFLGSPQWQEALAPDNLKRVRDKADELKIDLAVRGAGLMWAVQFSGDVGERITNDALKNASFSTTCGPTPSASSRPSPSPTRSSSGASPSSSTSSTRTPAPPHRSSAAREHQLRRARSGTSAGFGPVAVG
jgi:hypothetical protein